MAVNIVKKAQSPTEESGPKKKAGVPAKHPWEEMEKKFLHENMREDRPDSYDLKDVAIDFNASWGYVRQYATKHKWYEKLKELGHDKKRIVYKTLAEEEAFNEVAVRLRHATFARTAINKAMAALERISSNSLCARDAIRLLDLGINAERAAIGIADKMSVDISSGGFISKAHEDFERAAIKSRAVEMGVAEALKIIEGEFTRVPEKKNARSRQVPAVR